MRQEDKRGLRTYINMQRECTICDGFSLKEVLRRKMDDSEKKFNIIFALMSK